MPPDFHPGWRRAFSIAIPGRELRNFPGEDDTEVAWVPLFSLDDVAYIQVLLIAAGTTSVVRFDNAYDIVALALPSRGEVRVLVWRGPWTERDRHWADEHRAAVVAQARESLGFDNPSPSTRVSLHGILTDQTRSVVELAAS